MAWIQIRTLKKQKSKLGQLFRQGLVRIKRTGVWKDHSCLASLWRVTSIAARLIQLVIEISRFLFQLQLLTKRCKLSLPMDWRLPDQKEKHRLCKVSRSSIFKLANRLRHLNRSAPQRGSDIFGHSKEKKTTRTFYTLQI